MNIKDEIIEIRSAIEEFAKSQNITIDEASKLLLDADIDVRDKISTREKLHDSTTGYAGCLGT